MMTEMQPAMMSHMVHHMEMQGAKGAKHCPIMTTPGSAPTPTKPEEKKPAH